MHDAVFDYNTSTSRGQDCPTRHMVSPQFPVSCEPLVASRRPARPQDVDTHHLRRSNSMPCSMATSSRSQQGGDADSHTSDSRPVHWSLVCLTDMSRRHVCHQIMITLRSISISHTHTHTHTHTAGRPGCPAYRGTSLVGGQVNSKHYSHISVLKRSNMKSHAFVIKCNNQHHSKILWLL